MKPFILSALFCFGIIILAISQASPALAAKDGTDFVCYDGEGKDADKLFCVEIGDFIADCFEGDFRDPDCAAVLENISPISPAALKANGKQYRKIQLKSRTKEALRAGGKL